MKTAAPATIITVEVVYAPKGDGATPWRCLLTAQAPYTVDQALSESGVLLHFPEIELNNSHRCGVFGKAVSPNTLLKDHDRLEIYRPLAQDPKSLRIKRAKEQRKNGK